MKPLILTAREYVALRQGPQRKPPRADKGPQHVIVKGDGVLSREWIMATVPATANVKLRQHWTKRRKERQAWSAMLATGGPPTRGAPWKAQVVVLVYRKRLQDPDNQVASVKPLVDALRARGWLYDDSAEHVELTVWEQKSVNPETLVSWRPIAWEAPR